MPTVYRATRGSSLIEAVEVDEVTARAVRVGDHWFKRYPGATPGAGRFAYCDTRAKALAEAVRMIDAEIGATLKTMDFASKHLEELRNEHAIATAELALPNF